MLTIIALVLGIWLLANIAFVAWLMRLSRHEHTTTKTSSVDRSARQCINGR